MIVSTLIIVLFSIKLFPGLKHVVTIKELRTRIAAAANNYLRECSLDYKVEADRLVFGTGGLFKIRENPDYWSAAVPDANMTLSGDITEKYISVHTIEGCLSPSIMKLQSRARVFTYTEANVPRSLGYTLAPFGVKHPLEWPFFVYLENVWRVFLYIIIPYGLLFIWLWALKKKM